MTGPSFSFDTVTLPSIELEIRKLNPNKATACDSIPTKSLVEYVDICAPVLHPIVNNGLQDFLFPDKLADCYLKVMKKQTNYRPSGIQNI